MLQESAGFGLRVHGSGLKRFVPTSLPLVRWTTRRLPCDVFGRGFACVRIFPVAPGTCQFASNAYCRGLNDCQYDGPMFLMSNYSTICLTYTCLIMVLVILRRLRCVHTTRPESPIPTKRLHCTCNFTEVLKACCGETKDFDRTGATVSIRVVKGHIKDGHRVPE